MLLAESDMKPTMGLTLTALALGAVGAGFAFAAEPATTTTAATPAVKGRTIGYVLTHRKWALYTTPGAKQECPHGVNDGEREQFKILYPDDGTQRTLLDTQLKWEGETWHPSRSPEPYPFREVEGKIGTGLNLDGKIGPNDFTSPDGEKGIDNQLYRAIGCTRNYRADGETSILTPQWRSRARYNTFVIELTDVDSLANDPDVTVITYRGMDKLMADATGNSYLPGGTQTVDMRWGKRYIQKFHGKIVDGVLTTDNADLTMPAASVYDPRDGAPDMVIRDMRFQLKVSQDSASGYMGGYMDVDRWYIGSNQTRDTPHQNYGDTAGPSLYRAMKRLADAYPDKDGHNTAISSALNVNFSQVFVKHPEAEVAAAADPKGEIHTAARSGEHH
jgi:hypothetical protein